MFVGLSMLLQMLLLLTNVVVSGNENMVIHGSFPRAFYPKAFRCFDKSSKVVITRAQLNDDYCDCADGSDEPGTNACPDGRFYCRNRGFKGAFIPSGWVKDGVCDCCDGSDEEGQQGAGSCENTCAVSANAEEVVP